MGISLTIPDSVCDALGLPEGEIERALYRELALALYARWGLTMGLASRLGGFAKTEFLDALAERGILRHYTQEDLDDDAAYAQRGEQ